jgi:regulatory protein
VDDRAERLKRNALRLLAQREHSEAELVAKLIRGEARSQALRAARDRQRAQGSASDKAHAKRDDGDQALQDSPGGTAHSLSPAARSGAQGAVRSALHAKGGDALVQAVAFLANQAACAMPDPTTAPACEPTEMSALLVAGPQIAQNVPTPQLAQHVVAALKAQGYQSDTRTAQSLARHWGHKVSRAMVSNKLKLAGLSPREVDAATSAPGQTQSDFDTALALWQRKFGVCAADEREKAKHVRFLQSRGFSVGIALRVLKAAGATEPDR